VGQELTDQTKLMLYVPPSFAHGYQTLDDDSEVYYELSEKYAPRSERGLRWNDPLFAIDWPETNDVIINERDRWFPDYRG
jgi:dTDP-4-dehydrorhamnose 3,5-epimerase